MREFNLRIVTPDGISFNGRASSLLVRTCDGDVEILAGHTDYFAALSVGRARILSNGAERFAAVNGGHVSVVGGEVTVAAVTFEYADEIDVARAHKAKQAAEERIKNAKSNTEIDIAKAKLMRAISRINVAEFK